MNEPKLRFPEFTGEWEEKKLGEVVNSFKTGKLDANAMVEGGKYRFYTCAKDYSYIDSYAFEGDSIMIAGNGAHLGYVHHYDGKFNAYQRTYVLNNFKCDSNYLENCIRYYLPNRIRLEKKEGNMPYIVLSTLTDMTITTPPTLAEQRKIASCLSVMDDLIAAQAEKVEALKEKKTGLMQQMFPQAGETTPRLRFPEFTGDWEVKNLGKVCDSILVGFPFKGEDITDDASGHPILRAFSIGEGIIRHGKDYDKYYPYDAEKLKKYEVRKGDIVISMDGSVGKNIAMVSEKEERNLLIQRVARLRITDYPIHLIFQQIISQRFKDYAAGEKKGAVIAHISQKQIELFPIYVPDSPAEQQKIASCLSALDDQIAAETEKLTALKDYKKGLMQQLFPQPAK